MARSMPVPKLLRSAHNFAEKHVAINGSPNPDAFDVEWDAFCLRNPKLTDADIRIICAYALAALHYSPRKRYWVRANGDTIPIEHEAVDMPRGLWARNAGNIAGPLTAEKAAA